MSQVTVTAKTMGAVQITAKVIKDITAIQFNFEKGVVKVFVGSDYTEYSLNGVTTISDSISSGVHTLVIS